MHDDIVIQALMKKNAKERREKGSDLRRRNIGRRGKQRRPQVSSMLSNENDMLEFEGYWKWERLLGGLGYIVSVSLD